MENVDISYISISSYSCVSIMYKTVNILYIFNTNILSNLLDFLCHLFVSKILKICSIIFSYLLNHQSLLLTN